MNKVQRLIEQGISAWVSLVVGFAIYYFVVSAGIDGYETWFSDIPRWVIVVFHLTIFPVYMYGFFMGAIRLHRKLRDG